MRIKRRVTPVFASIIIGALATFGVTGPAHATMISFSTVALTGDAAPGAGSGPMSVGALFNEFDQPAFNDNGEVSFTATLIGGGVSDENDSGFFFGAPGGLSLIAREGDPSPFANLDFVSFPRFSAVNNNGAVAFSAFVENSSAIFAGTAGSLEAVIEAGDVAPGTGGAVFTSFRDDTVSINNSGVIAFAPFLSNGSRAIFVLDGPIPLPLAQVGDAVSGLPGFTIDNFAFSDLSEINDSGAIAVEIELAGPGVTEANNDALAIIDASGEITIALREGDPAPGGGVFGDDFSDPTFDNNGNVFFLGEVGGEDVVFKFDADGTTLIVRAGDEAPGVTDAEFNFFRSIASNENGFLAFGANLNGPGVSPQFDNAIFFDIGNGLELLLREGDLFDVGGGDLRTIASFSFEDSVALNIFNQFAFQLDFTDGTSGIFIANLGVAEIPLPAAAWIFLAGLFSLRAARRKQTKAAP